MESEIGRNSTLGWQWLWAIDDWRTAVSHTHIENKMHGFSYHKSEIYISFHTAVANLSEAMRQLTINYKQGWGRLLPKVIDQITITLNFLDFLQKCLRWQGFNFTKHPCHFIFFSDDIFLNLKDLLHHQIIFVSNDLLMIHRVGIQHIQIESTHTYTMYTTTYCNNSLYIIKP